MMKKILILDRYYTTKLAKSDKYEFIIACLTKKNKEQFQKEGYNVVGCFEDDYSELPIAEYPNNYLLFSFDSDRFLRRYSFEKRREILGKEISFWSQILDAHKPDFIINEVCTIEWMEVLYIEAKKRNIQYHTPLYGHVPHKTYWLDTPFNSAISAERLNDVELTEELLKKAESFCQDIIQKHSKPFYVEEKKHSRFKRLCSSIKRYYIEVRKEKKHKGFLYESYLRMRRTEVSVAFARYIRKYDKIPNDTNVEYIYYPLHYEPEATLSYFSEFYSCQLNTIRQISHCLNTNQKLIVKEHPQQKGFLLLKEYQNLKNDCNNLLFIEGGTSSYDILEKTKLLITLTGTGGYEAMICGKPVIVLGNVFYKDSKSVNYCKSFRDLKQLLRKEDYVIPNYDDTVKFVARFIGLQCDFFFYFVNDRYDQTDIDNMRLYIENSLI